MITDNWHYSLPGMTLWEWLPGGAEQGVLFYYNDSLLGSLPPMTDMDWAILDEAEEIRYKRGTKQWRLDQGRRKQST